MILLKVPELKEVLYFFISTLTYLINVRPNFTQNFGDFLLFSDRFFLILADLSVVFVLEEPLELYSWNNVCWSILQSQKKVILAVNGKYSFEKLLVSNFSIPSNLLSHFYIMNSPLCCEKGNSGKMADINKRRCYEQHFTVGKWVGKEIYW